MLSLLLDENIWPQVASQLQQKQPDISVVSIHDWRGGQLMSMPDETILAAAFDDGLTLVTYDQKTIMPILVEWAYVGKTHGGVIFIDNLTISTHDFGRIIRALSAIWDSNHKDVWINVVTYLRSTT